MSFQASSPLIAVLAANGVDEKNMTEIQRAFARRGWKPKVISVENGLIHSWAENTWGHCYPVDAKLEVSLGSDFDMLVLPDGQRNADRLKGNPHTRRFINAFLLAGKPVVGFGTAPALLQLCDDSYNADSPSVLQIDDNNAESMIAFFEQAQMAEPEREAA